MAGAVAPALAAAKMAVVAMALIPVAWLAHAAATDALGANPIEAFTHQTGLWTLRFLLLTLSVTPVRLATGWHVLLRFRRLLGLLTFFYALLHFTTYVWLDQFFDLGSIARDIVRRPFITVGFAAFVLLWPLALTSNVWAIRRLGGRRWQALHRSVYAIAVLACIHFLWLVKIVALVTPVLYTALLVLLLADRARRRKRAFGPWPAPPAATAHPVRFVRKRPVD